MSNVVQFALLGLGAGAVYALLAQGIVLIYRGSGLLNLAHGAFAMVGAYVFNTLHSSHGWPTGTAIVGAIAVPVVLGVVTDQVLLRRMRQASTLTRLIATLGVLIVLQGIALRIWGVSPTFVPALFPQDQWHLFGSVSIGSDRLYMLAIAVALTVVLTVVWRYSRVGWIAAAVSENRRGASALGRSPEPVSAVTWAVGAGLAGLAGVLVAPVTQLTVTNLTLIVIAALAAGLLGGFVSFPATLLGGLVIGIGQSETSNYLTWTGASDALPFVVIVIVLVLRGSSLPTRGYVTEHLPELGLGRVNPALVVAALAAVSVVIGTVLGQDWLSAVTVTSAVAVILLSLVVLVGYAGQLSLAQYALAGIGALICGRLVATTGVPFEIALVAGVAGSVVVGLVFALPALRTRGINLAVVTLGLGVATQAMIFNNLTLIGGSGGTAVGGQTLFGVSIDALSHPARYATLCFVLFVACAVLVAKLRRGQLGRSFIAVRSNERAAAAAGVSVLQAKLWAFGLSGAIAGLGGILLTFQFSVATFTGFDPMTSINAVAQVVVGGVGYVMGPVIGATMAPGGFSVILNEGIPGITSWLVLFSGVAVLVTLIGHPNGVASYLASAARRIRDRLVRRPGEATSEESAEVVPQPVRPLGLAVADLRVRYGGVVAVDRVSLEVGPGEVVGLIGPNGAGKTSLMDAVSGFTPCGGTVSLGGVCVDGWRPNRRADAGIVRSFQSLELFADMTVRENLLVASDGHGLRVSLGELLWRSRRILPAAALAAVREFGLTSVLDRLPGEISYGQRRLVAIARAVAAEPSVLLLDEPVAGLDNEESAEFARLVRRLADAWGMAVLVIEHDMDFVMSIADRLVVIDFGCHVATGTPAEIRTSQAAIAAYLGEEAPERTGDGAELGASAAGGEVNGR